MKQLFTTIILGVLVSCASRNNVSEDKLKKAAKNQTNVTHIMNAADILKDFKTWYNYTYHNIHLAQNFIGFDTDSNAINKAQFLDRLATGKFVPLKMNSENNIPAYQLYKLSNNDPDIKSTISQMALTETLHFKMEEKELPDYNFIDLRGNIYDKSTTKGKILVIKCWFIHCVACVKEFPELNNLVDKYQNRNDILFISLAIDSKPDLISFLNTKKFKYAVVPDKEKYMSDQLGITAYPTHILIGKNGKVVKIVNAISDLIPFIEDQSKKASR